MRSVTAENIKAIIKRKCYAQGAIGKKAGYNDKVFSNMLNGRRLITDIDVIKIANALEVEPNELYGISSGKSLPRN
ncbi:helix-turn-helix domain-containing protein [Qiania dongpingensis]|uniref:helix-turn-helix domain-containing protein n=1 Tax=Qiania dongpingensis TaxID=2763669 RepID=UPI00201605DA|nr:helix-turn-helix transcriptional regulator [Qiania dongpingensis]